MDCVNSFRLLHLKTLLVWFYSFVESFQIYQVRDVFSCSLKTDSSRIPDLISENFVCMVNDIKHSILKNFRFQVNLEVRIYSREID